MTDPIEHVRPMEWFSCGHCVVLACEDPPPQKKKLKKKKLVYLPVTLHQQFIDFLTNAILFDYFIFKPFMPYNYYTC